ncbi:MFS transporter [Cohnella rhizosphaerae]|uniref:MFS transporter n=1 Tax=Cohnella rhizosphaerae TaxID=1457232 RepID=A0A9X4L0K7_9BACL|nr:MFS transporter [Cohnella rhizosphaerae]MDG0811312.1 MFS transporter [Cohnella rhizosphaerae]
MLQGVGAGLLIPTMQNVLVQSSGGRNLGRLIAIISIPALIGPILGPVLGGLLIQNLDWRWIFYVNIPIMLVAIWLSWRYIPADERARDKPKLDIVGLLLLSPAFAALIYGISEASAEGGLGSLKVSLPLAGGIVLAAAYIVYALRARQSPLLDLRLFRSRHFLGSNVTLFLTGMVMNGAMLLLPLYYQQVRGVGVLDTGLLLIPQGLGMLATRSWIGGTGGSDGLAQHRAAQSGGDGDRHDSVRARRGGYESRPARYRAIRAGCGAERHLYPDHGVRLRGTEQGADPAREHRHADLPDDRGRLRLGDSGHGHRSAAQKRGNLRRKRRRPRLSGGVLVVVRIHRAGDHPGIYAIEGQEIKRKREDSTSLFLTP